MKYYHLFLLFLLALHAVPALADIAAPDYDYRAQKKALQRRAMENWQQRFPNLIPKLNVTLAPDGKALFLRLTFKSPADYSINLNDKTIGGGRVNALGGATQDESISITPLQNQESSWQLRVNYTLYGVENTRFGPKLTDEIMETCTTRRFTIHWQNGRAQFFETSHGECDL
ncbi:MAG: hypothetical protein IK129_02650 [Deltaproteobacteria bacterium]|nr:hypothetical protein [Deltaproteobacteria bacterium]